MRSACSHGSTAWSAHQAETRVGSPGVSVHLAGERAAGSGKTSRVTRERRARERARRSRDD
jgi:hypothetical protein